MGKSIMVSSLIHTNRGPDTTPSSRSNSPGPQQKPSRQQGTLKFANKPLTKKSRSSDTSSPDDGPCATLIIAPLSLLAQWKSELDRSSKSNTLKTMIYHGSSRNELETLVDTQGPDRVDVVVTSYGTLSSEHAKFQRTGSSSLFQSESSEF
jgi:DNA repair protein RAD5